MKKISAVWITGIILFLSLTSAFAQNEQIQKASVIPPYPLEITFNKTTNLIFPYAIKSVDKGSADILAQKAIGVENVLQIKAAKQGFVQTNLTVITADGSFFPYVLDYADNPVSLNLRVTNPQLSPQPVAVFSANATNDIIARDAQKTIGRDRIIKGLKAANYDIVMDVKGIYTHDDVLYFQVSLQNHSSLDYDIQSLRLFIRDNKRIKRTAQQEVEMIPVYTLGNVTDIPHASEQTVCIALSKFTIPDKKHLIIQLTEQNGGRHLSVKIGNNKITRSSSI